MKKFFSIISDKLQTMINDYKEHREVEKKIKNEYKRLGIIPHTTTLDLHLYYEKVDYERFQKKLDELDSL